MTSVIASKIINSVGLIFDISGAWFVAWEVVRKYNGPKSFFGYFSRKDNPKVHAPEVRESPEYKAYESLKYSRMKWGLFFLTVGFLFQILSTWFQYLFPDKNNEQAKAISEINKPIRPAIIKNTELKKSCCYDKKTKNNKSNSCKIVQLEIQRHNNLV